MCSSVRRHQNSVQMPKPVTRNLVSNDVSPESGDPVHRSLHTTDTESALSQVSETNSASDTAWSKSESAETTTSTAELLPAISQVAGSSALITGAPAESMRPKGYHCRDERLFLLVPLPCLYSIARMMH